MKKYMLGLIYKEWMDYQIQPKIKDGLMSKEDKQKLNRLQEFDISKLNEATKISPGLMSMEDKQKLIVSINIIK